jgi:glycerol kinase
MPKRFGAPQIAVVQQALASARILAKDIKAIGLTNYKRETTVVWDKRTGQPLHQPLSGKTVVHLNGVISSTET